MLYRKWGSEKDYVVTYTSSNESDREIFEEVKTVMKAHVIELYLSGYIKKDVAKKILQAINSFREYVGDYEDVHEALEDYIIKMVGEEGGWVGLGRSRNDHVSTALRLKMRDALVDVFEALYNLRSSLLSRAEKSTDILLPVYTHFQPAQPSSLAHYLLYVDEELDSVWDQLFTSLKLVNRSPLGSGAIVGTNVKLDRKREAELLGFEGVVYNTISATASRLDLISAISSLTLMMLVFSRLSEDLVLLSSSFIGIIRLPDTHVSTSSLMPQKRNAVTMEVLRTKVGECLGHLMSLMTIYKALPSGYNLDLQELNKHYWECVKHVIPTIYVVKDVLEKMEVIGKFDDKSITATDVAEDLALTGIPYRKAYMEVANKIKAGTFQSEISFKTSIEKKAVIGSPNPELIKDEISFKKDKLERKWNIFKEYKSQFIDKISELKVIEDGILQ
ncbi:argininosuccinate lyase [Stygiolobus caldivivus]|uniref:Argininosuccinate lyase n=1 Tax=Stygiolobus caldivivus TaxID=2824673 RepID=A0A8D5U996_9CREN|nr:argininosuccinate lyase [Stygiolobus caldivivus]BCU71405.1 argininosuccinate lyase [Stygiolobus caldivivus]